MSTPERVRDRLGYLRQAKEDLNLALRMGLNKVCSECYRPACNGFCLIHSGREVLSTREALEAIDNDITIYEIELLDYEHRGD